MKFMLEPPLTPAPLLPPVPKPSVSTLLLPPVELPVPESMPLPVLEPVLPPAAPPSLPEPMLERLPAPVEVLDSSLDFLLDFLVLELEPVVLSAAARCMFRPAEALWSLAGTVFMLEPPLTPAPLPLPEVPLLPGLSELVPLPLPMLEPVPLAPVPASVELSLLPEVLMPVSALEPEPEPAVLADPVLDPVAPLSFSLEPMLNTMAAGAFA
ncbi:MAG: hypothetical protein AB1409_09995 [Pseudomonadota bacterium]